ncbi:MAG: histidine kinase [Archangium sp.]|nr:histidine kinase [Archangium sp.]
MSAPRRSRPIGTRLFSLIGLGMIAPTLVIVWAGLATSRELEVRTRARDLLLASAAAERVSSVLAAGLEAANAVATQEPWTAGPASRERLRAAVRRAHVHRHALFDAFFVFDGAGQLVAGDTEGWQVDGTALVAEGRRLGRTGFAAAPAFPAGREGVVALVPLLDALGEVQLVLGARLAADSPRLTRLLEDAAPEPGQLVALHDLTGQRVAGASSPGTVPDDHPEVQRALLSARAPTAGACRSCGGGEGATWAVAPVGPAHWAVLVWQPLSQAYAFPRRLARNVGLAAVAMFLLAGLFAWGATVSVTRPLSFLTRAAGKMARGDLDAQIGPLPGDEVGALGQALEAMRVSVREAQARVVQLNAGLEARVAERTRELQDLNTALATRELERTGLLRRVISAQEDERKRIARELHDETSQQLAALSMGLDAAAVTAPESSRAALARLRVLAAAAISEVHRLILDLRPAVLDDLGLASAIEWCADRTLRARGVVVRCEFSGMEERLPWELETAVFRAAQEALHNVARHAHAEAVLVQVQLREGRLNLEIEDDGQGFDPASVPPPLSTGRGLGLLGMRERVESFGGTLTIDSAVGQGTRVRLEIVLNEEKPHG